MKYNRLNITTLRVVVLQDTIKDIFFILFYMYTCMFHTLYVKIFELANSQIYVEVN